MLPVVDETALDRSVSASCLAARDAVERRTADLPCTGGAAAREMPLIHRIFRRQFAEVRALVPEVPAADATRVRTVADHLWIGFALPFGPLLGLARTALVVAILVAGN